MSPAADLLLTILLMAAPADPPPAERLELASGETLEGQVAEFRDGALVFKAGADERRVRPGDLARLERWPARPARRPADGLATVAGDVLEGHFADLEKGRLRLESPRFGTLELDLKAVRAIFFGRALPEAAAGLRAEPAAEVVLVSGSRTPAELRWVQGDKLGLQSPLGALDVKRKDLAWIFLPNAPPEKPPAGLCRLLLSAGERLTGKPLALADGRLRLAWNGRELEVPWDLVRAIESPGEKMLYLSELKPAAEKSEAAVGPIRPPAADRAADGGALRLAGRSYERGLGMRATSEAAYRLDGRWKRFRALAGLDEEAARASRGAIFRVTGDGRKLFEKKLLPGEAPAPVDVEVGGVRELTLALEAGPGFEVGDYGDWADARLLR